MKDRICILFVTLIATFPLSGCAWSASEKTREEVASAARADQAYKVTYEVTGEISNIFIASANPNQHPSEILSADITYKNATGGTNREKVYATWKNSFTAKPGTVLSVSAQSHDSYDDSSGMIVCIVVSIYVDGVRVKTESSCSGPYVIASASGRL